MLTSPFGVSVRHDLAPTLLPVELVFWVGYVLPFGAVLGLARTALVVGGLLSG